MEVEKEPLQDNASLFKRVTSAPEGGNHIKEQQNQLGIRWQIMLGWLIAMSDLV